MGLYVMLCLVSVVAANNARESTTAQLEKENIRLHKILNEVSQRVTDLERNQQECVSRLDQQEAEIHQLKRNDIRNKETSHDLSSHSNINTPVAFTAYVSVGYLTVTDGTTIQFDEVVTNYGDAYNPNSGSFSCPVAGFYMFTATLNTFSSLNDVYAEIRIGGARVVSLYESTGTYSNSHMSVIAFCQPFQQVSVVSVDDDSEVYGTDTERYSSFSGTLLFTAV